MLRAHYAAASVDVLAAPVYHYRVRDGASRRSPSAATSCGRWWTASRPSRRSTTTSRATSRPSSGAATSAAWSPPTSATTSTCSARPTTSTGCCSSSAPTSSWAAAHGVCTGCPPARAPQVGARAPVGAARAARDAALPARRGAAHAAAPPPRPLLRRLPVPRPPAAAIRLRLGRRDPELALTARLEDLRVEDGRCACSATPTSTRSAPAGRRASA